MHQVDNLVISCIDFRFRAKIALWIKDELGDASDLTAIAGASKAILDEDTRATTIKQIDIAARLHDIKNIYILDHIDCGAYGGSGKFSDSDAEIGMHKERLEEAKKVLNERFPDLEVKGIIVDFDHFIDA